MITATQTVHAIPAAERERGIATITAAFTGDPVLRWVLPDAQEYLTWFPQVVGAFAGSAFETGSAHGADGFAGVALWLPPGTGPDEEAMGAILETGVPDSDKEEVFAFLGQMDGFHPDEPHWYLPLIGVDPAQQGRGVGGVLLRHALETCDRDGKLAYLEATSPRNRALYERHGFEEAGVIQAGSSPPMWPMVRKPR